MRAHTAPRTGCVARIDAACVGETVVALGGGRRRKEDRIDPSVGIEMHCEVGSHMEAGGPLFTVHAASDSSAKAAAEAMQTAFAWSGGPVESKPALIERD